MTELAMNNIFTRRVNWTSNVFDTNWNTEYNPIKRYMSPQMEKVIGAGANKFGYESETAPVVMPFIGRMLASALTATITINILTAITFISWVFFTIWFNNITLCKKYFIICSCHKRYRAEPYTTCHQTYELLSHHLNLLLPHGRVLPHSHVMNGFVGIRLSNKQKRVRSTSNELSRNYKKENEGRVVGSAVSIGKTKSWAHP